MRMNKTGFKLKNQTLSQSPSLNKTLKIIINFKMKYKSTKKRKNKKD